MRNYWPCTACFPKWFSAIQPLFHRCTYPTVASPPSRILLTRAVSASQADLWHEASWSGEGIATSFSSYKLAPFITPVDTSDLCAGKAGRGEINKIPPHTKWSAARNKDSCITLFLCCMQGLFGANSLPDLIYHDYPPSPASSMLIFSRELNS